MTSACQRARAKDEIPQAWAQHPDGPRGKCLVCGNRATYPESLQLHHDPGKGIGGRAKPYLASLGADFRLVPLCPTCHASQEVVNGLRDGTILPRSKWRE